MTSTIRFREISTSMCPQFVAQGHRSRNVFPHRVYIIPACGPDALRLGDAHWNSDNPEQLWMLLLHVSGELAQRLPAETYRDPDLIWHQEHFGLSGHVAFATFVLDGPELRVITLASDLVQRQSRRPELRTRIHQLFRGWARMLFNAVLAFAHERGVRRVLVPTSERVMLNTDASRQVDGALFRRVYDDAPSLYGARRCSDAWAIDVKAAASRVVMPVARRIAAETDRSISLCHDIERDLGHRDVDAAFAARIKQPSAAALPAMLAAEARAGVRATYHVVGSIMDELRQPIEAADHCLAFHSWDHSIRRYAPVLRLRLSRPYRRLLRAKPALRRFLRGRYEDQPLKCRHVDYRLRGYRPPQSRLTYETNDFNLVMHNFRWIASSSPSLGAHRPFLRNRLAHIPIAVDDFALHTGAMDYPTWKRWVLEQAAATPFFAISLHDCYAPHWLHDYPDLIEQLAALGPLKTLDEVAADLFLRNSV